MFNVIVILVLPPSPITSLFLSLDRVLTFFINLRIKKNLIRSLYSWSNRKRHKFTGLSNTMSSTIYWSRGTCKEGWLQKRGTCISFISAVPIVAWLTTLIHPSHTSRRTHKDVETEIFYSQIGRELHRLQYEADTQRRRHRFSAK